MEDPLYCPRCSSRVQMMAIRELCDSVAVLSAQVQELQSAIATPSSPSNDNVTDSTNETWAAVIGRGWKQQQGSNGNQPDGRGERGKGNAPNRTAPSSAGHTDRGGSPPFSSNSEHGSDCVVSGNAKNSSSSDKHQRGVSQQQQSTSVIQPSHQPQEKVPVKAKRSLWETVLVKASSSKAVKDTICQVVGTVKDKVQIKRKSK